MLTVSVQPPAGSVAPVAYVTVLPPALAASEPRLQPLVARDGGAPTIMPVGKVTVNVALRLVAMVSGLLSRICSVAVAPGAMTTGLKALLKLGDATATTVSVAVAGTALLPCAVTSAPAKMVFNFGPKTAETKLTEMQQPLAGTTAPAGVTDHPAAGCGCHGIRTVGTQCVGGDDQHARRQIVSKHCGQRCRCSGCTASSKHREQQDAGSAHRDGGGDKTLVDKGLRRCGSRDHKIVNFMDTFRPAGTGSTTEAQ